MISGRSRLSRPINLKIPIISHFILLLYSPLWMGSTLLYIDSFYVGQSSGKFLTNKEEYVFKKVCIKVLNRSSERWFFCDLLLMIHMGSLLSFFTSVSFKVNNLYIMFERNKKYRVVLYCLFVFPTASRWSQFQEYLLGRWERNGTLKILCIWQFSAFAVSLIYRVWPTVFEFGHFCDYCYFGSVVVWPLYPLYVDISCVVYKFLSCPFKVPNMFELM